MDDEYEDVPDDFFDDFSNADFIEGLNVIDSWEPPLESLPPKNDIIVIDDLDDCKIIDEYNQSSNDNVASNGTDKAEESLEKDSDALRNRSSSRHRERLRLIYNYKKSSLVSDIFLLIVWFFLGFRTGRVKGHLFESLKLQ